MRKKIELLSPAGNMDALHAAVAAGCDAVYLGCTSFSARAFAGNFNHEELLEAVRFCHIRNVKVYVTMNTLLYEAEMDAAMKEVGFLYEADVDALLIQDYGLFHRIRLEYPDFELHCSTQMHIHNAAGCQFMKEQGASRAVLARETSIETVRQCCKTGIEIEVFAYGALCVGYSGQCLMSSSVKNRSGNRGVCAQMCRLRFYPSDGHSRFDSPAGEYALAMKDLNVIDRIPELIEAGVSSLKIEGRMKKSEYVYLVTKTFREAIDAYYSGRLYQVSEQRLHMLERLFNRGFTEGYLFHADFAQRMTMDRPNHRGVEIGKVLRYKDGKVLVRLSDHLSQHDGLRILNRPVDTGLTAVKIEKKGKLVNAAEAGDEVWLECHSKPVPKPGQPLLKTSDTSLLKQLQKEMEEHERLISVQISCRALIGEPLCLEAVDEEGFHVSAQSRIILQKADKAPIGKERMTKALSKTGEEPYRVSVLFEELQEVFLPVNELNETRRQLLKLLSEKRASRHERKGHQTYVFSPREGIMEYPLIYTEEKDSADDDTHFRKFVKLPVVSENECDRIFIGRSILSNAGDLWMNLDHCIAGMTFNITNSWALAFIQSQPGMDAVILSSECSEEQIAAILDGYRNRYGLEAPAYQLVYGRRPMMFIKDYPYEMPYLEDLEQRMYPLIKEGSTTVILEPEPYRRANRYCRGSYLILTIEGDRESEAIKEEAYEEIFRRI